MFRPETGSRERARRMRDLARGCQAGRARPSPEEARDILAFLAMSLRAMIASVEQTASAWEKRGYWIKSDRFRRNWSWAEPILRDLDDALRRDDLNRGLDVAANRLAPHLTAAPATRRSGPTAPWSGSWQEWLRKMQHRTGPLDG